MSRRPKSAARAGADARKRGPRVPDSAEPASDDTPAETDVRVEIAQALAQLEILEAQQTEFRATFERAKAASGAELQALQSRIDQTERENRDLAAALEKAHGLQTEVVTLRETHATAAAEVSAAREALAGWQTRQAQAEQRIADLEQELAETTARAQADRLAEATRTNDLVLEARSLAQAHETRWHEAERGFAELSARHEDTGRKLAFADEKLALAREEYSRASEETTQARARNDALAAGILARDELCAALRRENGDLRRQIAASESAHALVEGRLRDAERRIAEAHHALALGDLRAQAWQDSFAGRLGILLLRARQRWSALKRRFSRTNPNPLFDEAFYLACNPDVAISGKDAYRHYLDHGAREGRDPHPLFATAWYLKRNPDVAASGVNPLVHYYETGASQLRDPHPDFSTRLWRDAHPEETESGVNPLEYFLRIKRDRT